MFKYLLGLAFLSFPLLAQTNGAIAYVTTAPSGSCAVRANLRFKVPDGNLYGCVNGTWATIWGSGGSGNVSTSVVLTTGLPVIGAGTTNVGIGTRTGTGTEYVSSQGPTIHNPIWDSYGILTCIASPGTPTAGVGRLYCDSTSKNISIKDDAGVVKHGVQTITCTNQFLSSINDAGLPVCTGTTHSIGASFDGGGSALTTSSVSYVVAPFGCTMTGYNVLVDTGTISIDVWKIASGTAIPTVANTILTGGYIAVASGTVNIVSGTSLFTTTTVTANDIFGFNIQAVSSATKVTVEVVCAAS